jgi:3-oxoacyl-[acyl-carrier protein] reductase
MNLGLNDKVALVLAASKGLGLACANGLFVEGAKIIICSRSQENLTQAKNEILKGNSSQRLNKILTIVVDLNFEDQIKTLVSKTLANEYAKDNILVNVVCPGPTLTNRMKELIKSQMS